MLIYDPKYKHIMATQTIKDYKINSHTNKYNLLIWLILVR